MGTRITSVDKPPYAYGHQHITHLGSDTERFTRAEVIRRIKKDPYAFYVYEGKDLAFLEVVNDKTHGEYVRTVPDGKLDDNLLSLPSCPPFLRLVA
jgi:Protein of unknown function (DUF3892)